MMVIDSGNKDLTINPQEDSLDMISVNTESAVMGLEKAYTEEDIEKARKNNQGRIEYEHNTEKYMNPENLI
jgi:hypothetical protein